MNERQKERLKVLFIQKHGRGLNRIPDRACIIARPNQLRYRCHNSEKEYVVEAYHVTIRAIGHGLLKKYWPLLIDCVLRTALQGVPFYETMN